MSNTAQSLASKRIEALLDENSFVEIGALVTARSTDFNMQQKETPSDGVITGYGVIDGSLVYVYSQDASVLNGTLGEMHARKIVHLYQMAMKMGAPVIGMIDCAGMRLQEATDALNAFGELYLCQVNASGVIPQITAVFGSCGGGMALAPAPPEGEAHPGRHQRRRAVGLALSPQAPELGKGRQSPGGEGGAGSEPRRPGPKGPVQPAHPF